MLSSTSDLTKQPWQAPESIQIKSGVPDPDGGQGAFALVNLGQARAGLTQTLVVPSNYQYCFSLYVNASQESTFIVSRKGTAVEVNETIKIVPGWSRIQSSGRLTDPGSQISVSVCLDPGQQLQVYGPQLEAQCAPSRYRANAQNGCVYPQSHWASDQLSIIAEAPNLYAVGVSIETTV